MLRKIAVIFIIGLMLPITTGSAIAAGTDDARQFVDNVGKRVLDIINGGGGKDQKQAQLRQMFSDNVDMEWMGKFVSGQGWRQATGDQRNRYMQAYKQYLLARYTTNFADYTGSKYTITDVKDEGEGEFTVNMQIKTPGQQQQNTLAGYRVHSENGQFKIIDIIIEGVSLITTQRSDFSSVLQQKGMDGLISAIEAKATAEKSGK